ncbi:MAG TPA: autotransporter-associated beta strand repeat-containing protein [Tepidisphaeraceae bacterium]
MRRFVIGFAASFCLALVFALPSPAQTWVGPGSDWNLAADWTPAVIPNSPTATPSFTGTDVGAVNISASVQAQSLLFTNPSGSYSLTSNAGVTLSGLRGITVGTAVTGPETINLANVAAGSLVFTGSGATVSNLSTSSTMTLDIGGVIGSANHAGLTFTGTGVTRINGSFASSVNTVTGGLIKSGQGTLILGGNGVSLNGVLALNGGTLQLDYSTNSAAKLGAGGSLNLLGGQLALVANTSTPITQTIAGGTAVSAGQTDLVASSAGGGTITLNLGGIGRLTGATLDVSSGAGSPAFSAATSNGNINGLLANAALTSSAFATVGGGTTWATASGGNIAGLSAGGYTANTFTPNTNVDVTTSATPAGFTANSLRFNTAPAVTLTLTGVDTLQSGGILVTPSATGGGTITGAFLTAPSSGELLVHQYSASTFTINSQLISSGGLTKTGPGTLALGGDNTLLLTGPVNVNRGSLTVTTTAAVNSASAINFNDARIGNSLQRFTVDLGNNTAGTVAPPIRLSAFANSDSNLFGTVFSTAANTGSRVTLAGVISSAPGLTTPIRFTGAASNTSGFNLTNAGNSFLGDVDLFQGTLGITADRALGDPSNTLILDTLSGTAGGLEFLNGGVTLNRPIIINSSTRVISNGADVNTIAGPVSSAAGNRPLVKVGTGALVLSGNGSNLLGGLTLSGGTLKLDYSANATSKYGGGVLALNGGVLNLVANTTTSVIQNNFGGTTVGGGAHTDVLAGSAGGGTMTFAFGAITRSAGATADFPVGNGGLALFATTTTGTADGVLGTGPAFATFGGGFTWATASGAGPTFNIIGFTGYDTNNYAPTSNTDVTQSATVGPAGITVNSLRFNTAAPTLTLNGTLTVQSGGILVTPSNGGGQIAGVGTLTAPGGGEILVHQYNFGQFAITAPIVSSAGLTKTGTGTLFLSGNNTGLTGPVNVNRGSLIVSGGTAPVNSTSAINFNDARSGANLQTFTVALPSGQNGTILPPIRLSAFAAPGASGTVFSTGSTLSNSRVTLSGVINSAPGLTTPIRFTGNADDSSGFNLTAANTFTGDVTVSDGTLGINSDASLGNPANALILQVSNSAAGGLEFLTDGITVARPVSVSGTRFVNNGTDSDSISGVVSGSGGFVKDGTGTLTLINTANTVTGTVTVQAGTLSLGNFGVLPTGTNATVNAGAVFNLPRAVTQTFGTVTLSGGTFRMPGGTTTATIVNQIVTDANGGTVDYSAAAGNNAVFLPAGSPGFTIAGNSTWLGPTAGTAKISAGNTSDTPIAISPGVTLTNGLALATSNAFGYRVTGGGTLFQNADPAGAALTNARLTIVNSRFRVTDAASNGGVGNLGAGTFTLDGGVLAYGGASAATVKPMVLAAGGGTIDVESSAATLTANGAISGPGALTKTGPGTLTLGNSGNAFTGLTINAGGVATADDNALGSNPVITVAAGGTLSYSGSTSSARTFNLNFGTLAAASAATVTLDGATVNGGFIRGPGAFALTGQTALNGVSTASSAIINQTGPASVANFTNGGQLTNAAGQSLALNNGVNASAGRLIVNGVANVRDFVSDGQVTVGGGGLVDNSGSFSSIVLGGGSRTTVNPGGSINVGGTSIELNGGLLVNNGTVTGTTNVHFNGEAVGTGTYGPVNLFENGRFAPGASASPAVFSPGVVAASRASFGAHTTLEVQIGGRTPGVNQDQLAVAAAANLAGTLAISNAPGFVSPNLYHYKVMSFASRSGMFTTYTGTDAGNGLLYAPIYTNTDLTLIATLPGDANVDAGVDFNDLVALAQSYNTDVSATTDNWWQHGDFTYDGKVDFNDLVLLAQHYNTSISPAPADLPESITADWRAALAAAANVPEPSCGMLILMAIGAASRRSRQNKRGG